MLILIGQRPDLPARRVPHPNPPHARQHTCIEQGILMSPCAAPKHPQAATNHLEAPVHHLAVLGVLSQDPASQHPQTHVAPPQSG